MKVTLEEITTNAERKICRIARVSNPQNQDNPNYEKLLRYCIEHQHWSVLEHAHMTLEIETSTAISMQILRHRSFTFQQFSQRYADPTEMGFEPIELRRQAENNRQSSIGLLDKEKTEYLQANINAHLMWSRRLYLELTDAGVAKECARFILPQCTQTRLYMTGNIRSWLHYLMLRIQSDVQLEHRLIALEAQKIFIDNFPIVSLALNWQKE